ncbi:Proto-oncogene serine/threonine-protein kinase pim-1 [Echinococcus granulosus]|uniref:Serine/threonine-protein kinase 1 n=1 Tax=Echinococcus granulosus TaxID=6210 RepID=U6J948_ECHGR|nr:Proto-oncogene serine/threonine-protein kinase pim-1 [Echinococcus granulosus]EUB58150.1 Proto-oncogene serine/threonine-protein kinase pim-1 [Echinococcus granulosus]CDS19806.1 proto oncogene serine:threonine protein kinase [Echinococcus granulosus]
MAVDHSRDVNKWFPEPRKLNPHMRYVERTSAELDIKLNVIRDPDVFDQTYSLCTQVGKGGFGKVFQARHNGNGAKVVIKQVDSDRVPCWCRLDDDMLPMEVVLLKKLSHIDGISRMLEVYDLHGTWHIVMAGNTPAVQDLFDYICKRGYLSECESAFIMYQLIGILLKCHEAGVLHRDLKDENLLIDSDNHEIQLIDFGSGAFLHDGIYNDFDGTRVYSPPEWIKTNGYRGKSAEIWTVGILLFDMINGDIPFMSDHEILSGAVQFRRTLVSHEAMDLIHCCCRLDPRERPTLMEILLHPWMRLFRNTISRLECEPSQYALDESAKYMPSPLASSITVRSGLCDLANLCIAQGNIPLSQSELKKRMEEEEIPEQKSGPEKVGNDAGEGERITIQTQENCEVSPDLLPIQSPESVSSTYNGHVHSGYLRRRGPSPPANNVDSSINSVFRRNSIYINPTAPGRLHRYDARHPQPDGHPFFRQQQQQQFSWDILHDFEFQEESSRPNSNESHNSSGYFTRSNSMEGEDDQAPAFQNLATLAQASQQFVSPASAYPLLRRGAPMDSSLTVPNTGAAAADKSDDDDVPEPDVLSTYSCLKRNLKTAWTPTLWAYESIRKRDSCSKCQAIPTTSSGSSNGSSASDGGEDKDAHAQSRSSKPRKF